MSAIPAEAANKKKRKSADGTQAAAQSQPAPHPDRYAAIVVDAVSGEVFFARNADESRFPASLTKIMTLYLTFEAIEQRRLRLTQMLPVSAEAAAQSPSKLDLQPGDMISVDDAIQALATKSANDAAVVLAEAIAGSEAAFAQLMTRKAHRLGMRQTVFQNASGLPNPDQSSSARDMAILSRDILRNFPEYYGYFSRGQFAFQGRVYRNHNALLETYAGTDGIKTGFIGASGFNLVASTVRGERRLIGVVFGGPTSSWRNQHMVKILDTTFARLDGRNVPEPEVRLASVPAKGGKSIQAARAEARQAPAPAVATPAPATRPVAGWAVQVGVYRQVAAAESQARQATATAKGLLDKTTVAIQQIKDAKGKLYRVRLAGLSETEARKACQTLKKTMPCLAVPLADGESVGSR
ncbi:MAG: D-alanyl-D-alanine carboxypeptidase [Alphaproteobacteria bacterium]|nr:D-alanyl-D-alanine carboxypeptidase [Alphaproteobacteria bacterium]